MLSAIVKEPIYHQLNSHLRQLITSGECPIGDKFLTERQICERYGVSRATANKALSDLVSEGLLEFRKGVGTFVRVHALDYSLRELVSFTDEAIAAGKRPSSRVLQLRLADNLPVILEKRYIVAEHCPGLTEVDLAGSLYAVWTERDRLTIEGADQRVRAVNLRGAEARALQVRDGAAGLLVSSVGYLTGGGPLWSERTLHRGTLTSCTAGSAESSQRAMRRASFWKQAKRRAE
jgi:GntR family transcriptional regulator